MIGRSGAGGSGRAASWRLRLGAESRLRRSGAGGSGRAASWCLRLGAESRLRRALSLAAVALIATVLPLDAQRIDIEGRGDADIDALLKAAIRSGEYHFLQDTLIARGDTVAGPVLTAGGTLKVEGVIRGDLLIVDANVFLRPHSRVTGGVTNIAGGYYPSALARVDGPVRNMPNAPYDVRQDDGEVRIVGTESPSLLVPDGFRGLHVPRYDRVDGVTLGVGAAWLTPRIGAVEPRVRGAVEYHSQRGEFGGMAELGFLYGSTTVLAGAERATVTNEAWIRSDLSNSGAFLVAGRDYRNYYSSDRAYLTARRELGGPDLATTAILTAQIEDATSLAAGDPWTVREPDSTRVNPPIDDGRIASAELAVEARASRPTFVAGLDARIELADEVLGGDFSFARFAIHGEWAMKALRNHTLKVNWELRGPLPGTDSLPRQRWSFVGGSSTLYTFDIGQFLGDRLVFVRTEYSIPLPERFRIPLAGLPALELLHTAGMAWTHDRHPDMEQNIGIRLQFPIFYIRAITNPDRFTDDIKFGIGLSLPEPDYPWSRGEARSLIRR